MQIQAAGKSRFHGKTHFLQGHFDTLYDHYSEEALVKQIMTDIYPKYIDELNVTDPDLLTIFLQFIVNQLTLAYESQYSFVKTSTLVELSVHLFCTAWGKRWNKDKTFEELKQILVRHSLFRPPHTIHIFSLQEIKDISMHFLQTLFRYYSTYFFVFTPLCDMVVITQEVDQKKDARDEEVDALRRAGEQYDEELDPELLEQMMQGNSVHQVPAKKREEIALAKAEKERQERIDRVLKIKLEAIESEFDMQVKAQDDEFHSKVNEIKNPPKKK